MSNETSIASRLSAANIHLDSPLIPIATYIPWVISGSLIHVSGQVSVGPSGGITGTVGDDLTLEEGVAAARLCGVNLLAQLNAALNGDLERVTRVVKLGGFVQVAKDFSAVPQVINGCSDLLVEIFGDRGRHARSSVGVYRLPRNFAVEIDAIVEVSG